MKFSKWLTFALSLCILGACVAIVWSFLSRRQQVVVLPETEILPGRGHGYSPVSQADIPRALDPLC